MGILDWCRLPMFSVKDSDGMKTIDLQATFKPTPKLLWLLCKIACLGVTAYSTYKTFESADNDLFRIAYLTRWGFVVSTLYLISSIITLFAAFPLEVKEPPGVNTIIAPTSARITWGLFVIAINVEIFITCMYWVLVFDGEPLFFSNIYDHGGLMLVVAFDGYFIHRIPIRFKQIGLVYMVEVSYLLWTVIHALAGIGNPDFTEDLEGMDDDALYSSLNWKERTGASGVLAVLVIAVAVPIIFLITWSISVIVPRRYLNSNEKDEERQGFDDDNDIQAVAY